MPCFICCRCASANSTNCTTACTLLQLRAAPLPRRRAGACFADLKASVQIATFMRVLADEKPHVHSQRDRRASAGVRQALDAAARGRRRRVSAAALATRLPTPPRRGFACVTSSTDYGIDALLQAPCPNAYCTNR